MGSGDSPGLQNRRAAGLPVAGAFDSHTLPPNYFVFKEHALTTGRLLLIVLPTNFLHWTGGNRSTPTCIQSAAWIVSKINALLCHSDADCD